MLLWLLCLVFTLVLLCVLLPFAGLVIYVVVSSWFWGWRVVILLFWGWFTALVLFMFDGCDALVFIIAFTGCGCVGLGCSGLLLWFCVCLLDYVNG